MSTHITKACQQSDNVNGITFVTRKHMSPQGPIFSLLTSFKTAFPSSTGQSCSSNCRKSGPLNHLPFISVTEMTFVKSSATFRNVGQRDQAEGFALY